MSSVSYNLGEVTIETIADQLARGNRVFIEPIGEVYIINNSDCTPQVEFIFDNPFLVGVVEAKIRLLKKYQENFTSEEE